MLLADMHKRNSFTGSAGSRQRGFTIIEVLIVIVIAALILLIVFLAVPAMQRNSRNTDRKRAVGFIAAQLEQYYAQNRLTYPDTPDTMCTFITEYLKDISANLGTCTASFDPDKYCVLVTSDRYSICYHDRHSNHGYVGPLDEISLQFAHNCNPVSGGEPIVSTGATTDNDIKHFVVWTDTEGAGIRCVDNFPDNY